MEPFIIEDDLSESTFSHAIVLDGMVETETTLSVVAPVYWRWEDDPNMEPQLLGSVVAGHELAVPFDLRDRTIRLFLDSQTAERQSELKDIKKATQLVFYSPSVAILSDLSFDSGTDDVTGTITNNGGGGNVHIMRAIDGGAFTEIQSVDHATASFTDSPTVDGDYSYKFIQDGLTGESNTETVVVNVGAPPAGSPPSSLVATYDDIDTISLTWTNNSGTGNNIVERKTNTGGNIWSTRASVSSATAAYDDTPIVPAPFNVLYTYRVRNESVAGYSNESAVLVPQE